MTTPSDKKNVQLGVDQRKIKQRLLRIDPYGTASILLIFVTRSIYISFPQTFCFFSDTTTCESMKAVPVLVCILLVITLSAAAPARKLVRDDGQQTGETQTKMEVIDGRPSSGYGDHVCPRSMFPGCS
jgi:hypothetical protein